LLQVAIALAFVVWIPPPALTGLAIVDALIAMAWMIGMTNAFNLLDNVDGLAAGVAAIAGLFFVVTLWPVVSGPVIITLAAFVGATAGFLVYNFHPASIFMGDSGSLFIGLLLAACSIARPIKSPTALIIGGPMLALALPVLDTLIVMKQRFGSEASLGARIVRMFNADRRHFHHILVEKYGSIGKAILSIWFITLLFAISAVLTVIEATKVAGYTIAIAGLMVMVFFRYWFRRGDVRPAAVERQA
jgi:UDP-GlcNAc:undecaprenyl-phosphate GlcNAc-1-phosphate transferase